MLSKKLQDALNQQINHELYSSYLYLAMSAHFEAANLPGFARWMKIQSEEEGEHGMKFYQFINDRSGRVALEAIAKPPVEYKTPLDVMKKVLEHEKKVTGTIEALYELALKEKDYPTQVMLHWFIKEQVEEEKNASDIIEMLKTIGDAPAGLAMLDSRVGARAKG
ncbi:MAG: ferritin [Ignavibacteria bacterium]|nr:ferritin [Ignavibacteria bacterium]